MASVGQLQRVESPGARPDVLLAIAASALVFVCVCFGGIYAAFAAVVLVVLIGLGLAKPEIATLTVVFVIYSDLAAVVVRSHGVPKVLAISFFALLLLPVTYYVVVRRERLRTDRVFVLMLLYLAVQVASAVSARDGTHSLQVIASFVTEGVAVYFLLLNSVRTPATLRRCLWMMIAAGLLLGSVSIIQNRTYRHSSDFGGLALTRSNTTQEQSVVSSDSSDPASDTRQRALGPIGDANFYAQIMVVLLPIAILRFWAERKGRMRWLGLAAAVPILGAIVLTFSRGAAVAVAFFGVSLVVLRYMKARHAVIAAIAAIIIVAMLPEYGSRITSLMQMRSPGLRSADASIQERTTIYLSGFRIFLDHPVLGVGVGQAPEYLPEYSNYNGHSRLRRKMGAHNMYLESLAETGLLGFCILMTIAGVAVTRLWRVRKYWQVRNPEYAHTVTGLLLAIAVFLVTGLFLHLAYARYFWLLLAMAGAACAVYAPQEQGGEEPATQARPEVRNYRRVPTAQQLFES